MQDPAEKTCRDFFSHNGTYQISPSTTSGQMRDDANCILDSVVGMLSVLASKYEDAGDLAAANTFYGLRFQLEMVANLVEAMRLTP